MPEPSDILAFIKAVLWTHWVPIVTSIGVPPLVEQAFKSATGNDLPYKFHFRWIVLVGAFIAMFLAWDDEFSQKQLLLQDKGKFEEGQKTLAAVTELQKKTDREALDLRMAVNELNRDKADLQRRIDDKEKVFTAQIAALRQSNLEKDKRFDEKDKRMSIREQLGRFLAEAKKISDQCGQPDYRDECPTKEWETDVRKFLEIKLGPSYVVLFDDSKPMPGITTGSPTRSHSLHLLEGRKESLREIIKNHL